MTNRPAGNINVSVNGLSYIMLSVVFFSLMQVCVKALRDIPTHEIVFFRGLIALIICLIMIRSKGISPWGNNRRVLLLRGLFGTTALFLFFYTLKTMPLASAATIQHLAPIFTIFFAGFIVGEWSRPVQYLFFLTAFVGVAMIKGFDPRVSSLGLTLGVIAAASSGLAYNCIRKLAGHEDTLVIILYFPLITVPVVGSYTIFHFVWPNWQEWGLLLLVGIFVQFAQVFMTKGLVLEKASNIIYANYTGVLLSLAWGYLLFNEAMPPAATAGIVVVLAGVILANRVGDRKRPEEKEGLDSDGEPGSTPSKSC